MIFPAFRNIENDIKHALLFAFHTALAVFWYAVCVLAAKATYWLGSLLDDQGYTTFYIFKPLESFFLVLGAIVAILYFSIKAWELIIEIWKNKANKKRGRRGK